MFTGDRSGDWLYGALHRAGFAERPESRHRGDGQRLIDAYVTAPVRCAPPGNSPSAAERAACRPWLDEEIALLPEIEVVVCLGGIAYEEVMRMLDRRGTAVPRPRPRFGHGIEVRTGGPVVLGSYHPSQQNTFTGRLTEEMFDAVFSAARARLDASFE
jgi:uracil-DNA glycosylase family 4